MRACSDFGIKIADHARVLRGEVSENVIGIGPKYMGWLLHAPRVRRR
jgi:hypothetical protein